MVAIALPTTTTVPGRSRRPLPSGGAGRGHRPALQLVPAPGRARLGGPALPGGVAMRTLLGAAFGLAVVLAAVALALTPAPAPGASAADTSSYVAEAGDTMWSIAVAHAPAGEAATYVESLVAANGTARVAPGQAVVLPAP